MQLLFLRQQFISFAIITNSDGTLIRAEERPKVLAHPLQLVWLKQISHLLWQITPWVDIIGATVAIIEFPPRTPLDSTKSP